MDHFPPFLAHGGKYSVSTGYNFYHPPRRIRSKAMIPPVHRSLQAVDTRPYVHRSNLHRNGGNRSYRHPGNFRSENPILQAKINNSLTLF